MFSLFAIATTYAITVVFFDTSSILAPVATLTVGFLSNIYVYFGLFVLMLGAVIPVGNILKYLRIIIEGVASWFSSLEFASFSVSSTIVKILGISLTLFIIVFFVIKINRKKLTVALIATLYLFINIFGIALAADAKASDSIKYRSYGNEFMIVTGDNDAYFIDFGESNITASYNNSKYAYENNICVIDYYYLLTYSEKSINSINSILSKIKINNIRMPMPSNTAEVLLLEKLRGYISEFSCEIQLYSPKEEIKLGDFELLMITRSEYDYSPKSLSFVIAYGEKMYGYTSLSALEVSKLAESLFYTCESVIVGDFGDSLREKYQLDLSSERLKFAIISSDNTVIKSNRDKAFYQKETEITP